MPVDAKYKTQATASGGGRDGKTALNDGTLSLQLVVPKELGGPGGDGANPEKLFALGYSACYLGAMRVAAQQLKTKVPDGSTVDADGCLWNAEWDGGRIVRYTPDGRVDREVKLPVQKPTSCMFGGPDLSTLYVTSAIWDHSAEDLKSQPQAGGLFALDVGVRGLPEPRFAG